MALKEASLAWCFDLVNLLVDVQWPLLLWPNLGSQGPLFRPTSHQLRFLAWLLKLRFLQSQGLLDSAIQTMLRACKPQSVTIPRRLTLVGVSSAAFIS